MKFRYYLLHRQGALFGTNDRELAEKASKQPNYICINAEAGTYFYDEETLTIEEYVEGDLL